MATTYFRFLGSQYFNRSHVAGGGVVLRSTVAGDDGTAKVFGVETTSGDLVAESLATMSSGGSVERYSSTLFDSLSYLSGPDHTGIVSAYSADGSAASGDARCDTNPTAADTITIGVTGFTQVYTFQDTLASAFDVKIGVDADATAANLKAAINADGTPGVEYYTGTTANLQVSATVVGAVVTLTDRIPCDRLLGWTTTESSTNWTIRTMVGGADGTRVASIGASAGDTVSTAAGISLNDPAATTDTFPELISGASSYATPRGRCSIYITAGTIPGGDVALKYQTSPDAVTWSDGATSITNLATDADQIITPTEHIEHIRLNVTSNTLTGAIPLDARIIY